MEPRKGRYSDGRSAASRPVAVHPTPKGIEIRDELGLLVAFWQSDDLRSDGEMPDGSGARLRCRAEPDARLVVADPAFVRDSLPAVAADKGRRRRSGLVAMMAAAALAAAIAVAVMAALPLAARSLTGLVPVSLEAEWGRHIAAGIEGQARACRRPAGEAALAELAARLAARLPADRRVVHLRVLDTPMVNAIALPGGNIVVFRGLLDLAEEPDEVAGVLAHELVHVAERHPTAAVIRGLGLGLVVTVVTGDASGMAAGAAASLLASAYSRDDEAAADRGAVALLEGAGIGAGGLASFFHRMAESQGGSLPQWLSTHPEGRSRAATVEAAASRLDRPPSLRDEAWRALKGICR